MKKMERTRKRNVTEGRSMKVKRLQQNTKRKFKTGPTKYETMLHALHMHASQLSVAKNIETIIDRTLDAMEASLGFKHNEFLLAEKGALQIKGNRGQPTAFSAYPLDGRGLVVKAANTRTTLMIHDTRKEPDYVDNKGYDWTGPHTYLSELIVPVLVGAETVAVLSVDSAQLHKFTDDDQRLLETLAVHVGSALDRSKQEEQRAKYATGLLALHRHASQLSMAKSIDTLVKQTLEAIELTLGFQYADFMLVENRSLVTKRSIGQIPTLLVLPLDGRGLAVRVAKTKLTLRISDTRKEPDYVDLKGYDWNGAPSMLSELIVPVLVDAEVLAVLAVSSIRLDAFTDDDQKLLETLAIHVGTMLARLRNEEELQKSEQRYHSLFQNMLEGYCVL